MSHIASFAASHLLIFSMICAAFAAAVLVRKTHHAGIRVVVLVCLCVFLTAQFAVMRLAGAMSPEEAEAAARVLYVTHALGAIPWALLAALVGGVEAWWKVRGRSVFVGAVVVGGVALATMTSSDLVFSDVSRSAGFVRVSLGVAGKLLLVYLTAVAAFMLTQVETLLRAFFRVQDRVPRIIVAMLGLSVIVYVYVAAEAFLYGRFQANTLATASLPAAITCVALGVARLRRSLDDTRVPVARGVIYSSFTLFVLGVLMILLGLMSRVAELAGVSLNQTFFLVTSVVAVGLAISLWVSPTWKRRVSEFIDENFYVNRHDYRREWTRMAREVRLSHDRSEMICAAGTALCEMFHGSSVYVGIADPSSEQLTVYDAKGEVLEFWAPPRHGALANLLLSRREAIPLGRVAADLELVPAFVENQDALVRLGGSVVAPMLSGGQLVGFLLLCSPRGDAPYSPEDLGLMTVVGAELANAIYGHLLLREVEERREGEALMKLSSFVLHDLKNCVASIQNVLEGADRHMDEPEFRKDLVASLTSTGHRMSRLMTRLGELRAAPAAPRLRRERCEIGDLVSRALEHCAVQSLDGVTVRCDVPSGVATSGDPEMLEQVLVNVVRNALEAMENEGTLTVRGSIDVRHGMTRILVEDGGCGMDARFVAESLFRPFVSTKSRGLGIGLYQCKNIIEEHGGRIRIETKRGEGTRVELSLPAMTEAVSECEIVS